MRKGKDILFFLIMMFFLLTSSSYAAPLTIPKISIGVTQSSNPQDLSLSMQILFILTILSVAPSIIILMTSFTRIVIVLSFVRQALGTQMIPPNQVLLSFALFLTYVTMSPVINQINKTAYTPYIEKKISQTQALNKAMDPVREFMFRQTREKDIALLMEASRLPKPKKKGDIPTMILVASFVMSEMKTGFEMGFALFIAFIIIDMVVASVLMSLGMMMIPPMMVSMPLKILIFVLADGWNLVTKSIIQSFR